MMPLSQDDQEFALTVVDDNGEWKLLYSNKTDHNYHWCFSSRGGVYAIRWCGDSSVVLHLDNNLLHPTNDQRSGTEQHYISNFHYLDNIV